MAERKKRKRGPNLMLAVAKLPSSGAGLTAKGRAGVNRQTV